MTIDKKNIKKVIKFSKSRASGIITDSDVMTAFVFFGGRCPYSATSLNGQELNLDHIIPVSMGGSSDPWNMLPVCGPCNKSKGSKHLLDWWEENRNAEEEYRLEKVFYYILKQLNEPRDFKIKEVDTNKKQIDTWLFLTQMLTRLRENKNYLNVTINGKIKDGIDLSGSEEYKKFLLSNNVDERLKFYALSLINLYNENSNKQMLSDEVYKKQNELVNLLKKYGVLQHYEIAFNYYDKIKDIKVVEQELVKMQQGLSENGVDVGMLINRNPNILLMDNKTLFLRLGELQKITNSNFEGAVSRIGLLDKDFGELKNLIDYCNSCESKISFDKLSMSLFSNLGLEEIKHIVDYISNEYPYPEVCGSMHVRMFNAEKKLFLKKIDKFINEQIDFYEEQAVFWDSYLKSEQREGHRFGVPKVVVTPLGENPTIEEKIKFKENVVRCLGNIMSDETFGGKGIYGQIRIPEKNPAVKNFFMSYYGIDLGREFSKTNNVDRTNRWYNEQIVFWDSYLQSKKREGKFAHVPKIVVKPLSSNATETERADYKESVARCLEGIMKGEIFSGVNTIYDQTHVSNRYQSVRAFFKSYYGVDLEAEFIQLKNKKDLNIYNEQKIFWDAYLNAEKREGECAKFPKIVVKPLTRNPTDGEKREYKKAVVRCLNDVMVRETYRGLWIYQQTHNYAKTQSSQQFFKDYYGIDLEKDSPKIKEEDERIKQAACGKLGIRYHSGIAQQNIYELKEKIDYIAENFGKEYITNETIGMRIDELKEILPYLKLRGLLFSVVSDPITLRLSPEQIEERIKVLRMLDKPLVTKDKKTGKEKISYIFTMMPGRYSEFLLKNNIDVLTIDEQLDRKFNQENTD